MEEGSGDAEGATGTSLRMMTMRGTWFARFNFSILLQFKVGSLFYDVLHCINLPGFVVTHMLCIGNQLVCVMGIYSFDVPFIKEF